MDEKTLARLGAIIFIALAITATVIDVTRKERRAKRPGRPPRHRTRRRPASR